MPTDTRQATLAADERTATLSEAPRGGLAVDRTGALSVDARAATLRRDGR